MNECWYWYDEGGGVKNIVRLISETDADLIADGGSRNGVADIFMCSNWCKLMSGKKSGGVKIKGKRTPKKNSCVGGSTASVGKKKKLFVEAEGVEVAGDSEVLGDEETVERYEGIENVNEIEAFVASEVYVGRGSSVGMGKGKDKGKGKGKGKDKGKGKVAENIEKGKGKDNGKGKEGSENGKGKKGK